MKNRSLGKVAAALLGLIAVVWSAPSHAGTNLLSTNVVGGNTGWFTANIWKTNNGSDVPVGNFAAGHPSAGNTYKLVQGPNPAIGNNQNGTRTRNVYTSGVPAIVTFPGDSLELTTNTEVRFKRVAAGNVPTINFPGVGGNPGLILNGGMINVGDADIIPISGSILAAPNSQSYICPGNNDGASVDTARAFRISASLSGSGTLVIFEGGTNNAQQITSSNNTYSGMWIVKAGRLLGAGVDSLGTNSSFTLDPNYVLPVPPFSSTAPVVDAAGPAVLEVNYDLNSAGTLVLVNGGKLRLHQNVVFTAATIEGTPLSPGPHFYPDLVAAFPNNFDPGGSGSITIQPYGPPPSLGPTILTQPGSQLLHPGRTAHFTVTAAANGAPPLTFRWRRAGVNLSDGGNILGATNAALTVTGVSALDDAAYDVVVSNASGSLTSAPVALTIVALTGEPYEAAVAAANPVAFYQLNETGDPATNNSPAYDYVGGFNGTFGDTAQNGNPLYNIAGPEAAFGYPGFPGGNKAVQSAYGAGTSRVAVPPWNLSNNTVTVTAWIKPDGLQAAFAGLVFCRGGGTVAGLGYAGTADINGIVPLTYHWNDEFETRNWNTGIGTPSGQWSFVALVVTPSNATIHVMNTNGLLSASQDHPHIVQSFAGTTLIGDDSAGAGGARVFNGIMDDVAVFNRALSTSELLSLYTNAAGAVVYAPLLGLQPASQTLYAGQTAQFTVTGGGSDPLTYQWQAGVTASGVYTNLADGGRISGSGTPTLTIANLNATDALDYLVTLANSAGSVTSSIATLTVQATGAAENITMSVQQAAGADWDTAADWSDGQAASVSAVAKPGSTYELLAGARLRTPLNPTVATFPGDLLTLAGDGVWNANPVAGATISEIRFKQPTYGSVNGTVIFPRLVMNGGQLDAGNDGILVIGGRIDILKNTPINNDGGNDRGYRIEAWLTGTNNIEFHGYTGASFQSAYRNPLNIAGTSNTFSGKWTVVQGVLLGSAPGSLGTNDIIVGANGALETLYDINNTNANLVLNGRLFLHQNHTFRTATVAGNSLNQGTYTYSQLAAAYPANFPATWTPQTGSTFSNATGSLTVLAQSAPAIVTPPVASQSLYPSQTAQFFVSAVGLQPLAYQWRHFGTNLADGTTPWGSILSGATGTNLTVANITNADGGDYTVVITNSVGSITSSISVLNLNPVGPPESITISAVQPTGNDWNTGPDWSDGLPAATSALAKPGSTYEVLPGARLRTPVNSDNQLFPGEVLTVSGDGVFAENGTSIGELRFKHIASGVVRFKRLVMNGGQLDSGDNGVIAIAGRMDVLANTPIYADSAAGQDRPYQIDAWLTGNGSIEYHAFNNSFSGNLNITGTSNTYSGTWNIVQGVLFGSGANSLGTNDITIGASAALETSYEINNPHGGLVLDGQLFLHQHDTFHDVTVAGVALAPGTYSFAQLNAAYPANFPAAWPQQLGSGFSTGSGSLTVLTGPAPVTLSFQQTGANLELIWSQGWLLEADEITGPWTTNTSATSPFTVVPSGPKKFYRIQTQ